MQVQILFGLFYFLILTLTTGAALLEPVIENVVHLQTSLPPPDTPGIWKKKLIWKARWVQEWKSAKEWRPVWRKVWSPVEIREWLPIPRPPPEQHKPVDNLPLFHPTESYGPPSPQTQGPSTVLRPVTGSSSDWPLPDMQELLLNYHTIRDPEIENTDEQPTKSQIDSPNPEKHELSQFLEPPKINQQSERFSQQQTNISSPLQQNTQDARTSVSPYAAKLAQAVLREKFNQSLNPTERPSGLTDVIYKPVTSSTSPPPPVSTSASPLRASTPSTPSGDPKVYIVTPVSLG